MVTIDPWLFSRKPKEIKAYHGLIVTRDWPLIDAFKQDITRVPLDIIHRYPLSGMLACKIGDWIGRECGCKSYCLGMDAGVGHYDGHPSPGTRDYLNDGPKQVDYESLELTNTINLSVGSRIEAWPKLPHLPYPPCENKADMLESIRRNVCGEIQRVAGLHK
jgi:hypothetical protein